MLSKLLYLVFPLMLSGCTCNPAYIDTTCIIIKPIRISKKDKITDETLRQIHRINIVLEKKCYK